MDFRLLAGGFVGAVALANYVQFDYQAVDANFVTEEYSSHDLEIEINQVHQPILQNVKAYVVFDVNNNKILHHYNGTEVLPIASITKLFAGIAIHDVFDLEKDTVLHWSDLNSVGTAGNLQYGQAYTYRELLFPLLLSSSNNSALTFENRTVEKYDFILSEIMRNKAIQYGAKSAYFADASGLSYKNAMSSIDLAHFVSNTIDVYPYVYNITRLSSYLGPYTGWVNNSPFIDDESYVGGKHGYTPVSGRTAVSLFRENFKDTDVILGYIILGSDNLVQDMTTLRRSVVDLVEIR